MAKIKTNADDPQQARVEQAEALMVEALGLVDNADAALSAIYLDQALATLRDRTVVRAAKP